MKKGIASIAAMAAMASFAETYFFVGGTNASWQELNSYRLGARSGATSTVPPRLPGAEDTVLVGAASISTSNIVEVAAKDINFIAGLNTIGIRSAHLILNVETNSHLNCAIYGVNDALTQWFRAGVLTKKGDGDLYLDSRGKRIASGGDLDYISERIIAEKGNVYLMHVASARAYVFVGVLKVLAGAHIYLPPISCTTFHTDGFEGDGDVSYEGSTQLNVNVNGYVKSDKVFDGVLSGKLSFRAQMGAHQQLTGANSFSGSDLTVMMASNQDVWTILGFSSVDEDNTVAQPLSTASRILLQQQLSSPDPNRAPILRYTGVEGGTLTKKIQGYSGFTGIIDGGDHGGLRIATGGFLREGNTTANPGVARLVFQGDGQAENVFDAILDNCKSTSDRGTLPFTIVKKGAGTWKFTARSDHYETGVYAVDEGTLRFGSIAPVGTSCSLGLGTLTYDPEYSCVSNTIDVIDTSRKVGYHIRLGGGTTSGTLEYVGTEDVTNGTRIIAVNGRGTLKNSSGRTFIQRGITTVGAGDHAITLDGVTAAGDVTNGVGTLSVAVDAGEGTTTLMSDLTFNGSLAATAGHLKISNPTNYSYFRFTVKENMAEFMEDTRDFFNKAVRIAELAMFDEEGRNVATNLTVVTKTAPHLLGENEACCQQGTAVETNRGPERLFDDSGLDSTDWYVSAPKVLDVEEESSWIVLTMRIPMETPRIVAFDMVSSVSGPNAGTESHTGVSSWYVTMPRVYLLEGSLDGKDWHELYSENDNHAHHKSTIGKWVSSNGATSHTPGAMRGAGLAFDFTSPAASTTPFYSALANVSNVTVAAGATLEYFGVVAPLASLTVDAADGIGTLRNVTLAGSGTLHFVNVPEKGAFIPVDWSGVNNADAIVNWDFDVEGSATTVYSFAKTANGLRIVRKSGTVVLFQ